MHPVQREECVQSRGGAQRQGAPWYDHGEERGGSSLRHRGWKESSSSIKKDKSKGPKRFGIDPGQLGAPVVFRRRVM